MARGDRTGKQELDWEARAGGQLPEVLRNIREGTKFLVETDAR